MIFLGSFTHSEQCVETRGRQLVWSSSRRRRSTSPADTLRQWPIAACNPCERSSPEPRWNRLRAQQNIPRTNKLLWQKDLATRSYKLKNSATTPYSLTLQYLWDDRLLEEYCVDEEEAGDASPK